MNWISVKDRLPEKKDDIFLGFRKSYYWYEICIVRDKKICIFDLHEEKPFKRMTHWMPLPEPPKE